MFIEKAYLFQGMSPEFMDEIAKHLTEESLEKGAHPFWHGEPANFLFVLREGRVRLSVGEEGHVTHTVSEPGDAFGWSSLVGRESYTATAECLVPTKVIKFRKDELEEIFRKDPASGYILFRRLSKIISQRLVDTYKMLPSAHGGKAPVAYP